jgi:hypothetical protein
MDIASFLRLAVRIAAAGARPVAPHTLCALQWLT